MNYLGITQATASWVLGKPGMLDAIHDLLIKEPDAGQLLANEEFVEGSLRFSVNAQTQLLCFWNSEYLTGAGDDRWGFVTLGRDGGLAARPQISREVLERCLYIISQRLQGL